MRVLFVEDDYASRVLVTGMLEHIDHRLRLHVSCVDTLADAKIGSADADVVILDLTLPKTTPECALDWAKELVKLTPVIVITGTASPQIALEAGKRGIGLIDKKQLTEDLLELEIYRAQGAWIHKKKRHDILVDTARKIHG